MGDRMRDERLARSGLLSLIGSAASALSALVIAVIIGNALGAYGTGLFFQAVGFFTIASQVLRLGTNSSLVRTISEHQAFDRRGETWRVLLIAVVPVAFLGILAGALVWVFSEPLANWLASPGESARLRPFLELMAPFISVGALLAVLQIASRMVNGISAYTFVHTIVYPTVRLVAVSVVVYAAGTAFAAFGAWLAVIPLWVLVSVGLLVSPLRQDWRRRSEAVEPLGDAGRRFWRFSATRAVGGSLEILLEWTDVLIVAAIASPAEAGIYAVVTRTVRAGQVVDRAMRLAVSPRISRHLAKGELAETRELHTTVTRAMVLVSWPYYLTLAIMGPSVLLLFGTEFEDGAVPLLILSLTMLVTSSAGMLQSIILQGGRSSWQVLNKSIVLATSVALNLALVPLMGIVGAAITWAVVGLTDTCIAAWQVHRRMGVWLRPRPLLPAMLTAAAAFGVGMGIVRLTLGTSPGALVVGLAAVGLVYAGALWLLRGRLGIVALWKEFPVLGRFA